MIVLDTNLLVRLATNDVPHDRAAIVELLERHDSRIPKTVLLETEWVLRSRYGYSNRQSMEFVEYLLALPSIHIEDESVIHWAVNATNAGLDFADALHLSVAAAVGEAFYTLDRTLHRKASRLKDVQVYLLRPKS